MLQDDQECVLLSGEKPEAGVYELHWGATIDVGHPAAKEAGGKRWSRSCRKSGKRGFRAVRDTAFCANTGSSRWTNRVRRALPVNRSRRGCCEAAVVTQSCRLQSREFYGESTEKIVNLINAVYPEGNENAFGAQHEAVLACRDEAGKIAGVLLTAVYGYGESWGPVAWVREIAVLPEQQGKGYGRALVESALNYCRERGAVKAFLMADDCNAHAISLYRSIGFEPSDEVQIDSYI